jgi:hypothetical protein
MLASDSCGVDRRRSVARASNCSGFSASSKASWSSLESVATVCPREKFVPVGDSVSPGADILSRASSRNCWSSAMVPSLPDGFVLDFLIASSIW